VITVSSKEADRGLQIWELGTPFRGMATLPFVLDAGAVLRSGGLRRIPACPARRTLRATVQDPVSGRRPSSVAQAALRLCRGFTGMQECDGSTHSLQCGRAC